MVEVCSRLKGLAAFVGVLALLALGLSAGGAMAEAAEALTIDFSLNPAELVAPGDVQMTFIITNQTDGDINNIYLTSSDGLLSEPVGTLAAGETHTLTRPHAVTESELDAGYVRYTLSHDAQVPGGEKVRHTLSAPIRRGDARPDVDFTRQFSSRYVAPGQTLTVTYRVTNNGNVPVSAVSVRDDLGNFTGRLERLEVGGTRTFISRVALDAPASSAASLEYSVPSGDRVTRQLEPLEVDLSDGALEMNFSVNRSVFDPNRADAVLVLTNAGSDHYTDLTVLDDVYGGVIADCVSLTPGGKPAEIAFTYPVRGQSEYRWRVTGISQSGEALDFKTETITLPDEPLPGDVDIRLNVTTETPKISRPGGVRFDLSLSNEGSAMARNLMLYEVNRGTVRRLAVLPTGDPARFSTRYDVQSNSRFIFCLNYEDGEGRARTISADPIDVEITPSGALPELSEPAEGINRGGSVKFGSSSTFTILLAVASAALISLFTILVVTSLKTRQDRHRRAAGQKRRAKMVQPSDRAGKERRKK